MTKKKMDGVDQEPLLTLRFQKMVKIGLMCTL